MAAESSMANVEGATRMKGLGRMVFKFGLFFTVVGGLAAFLPLLVAFTGYGPPQVTWLAPLPTLVGVMMLTYLGLLPQVVGGALWVCGWVVEGFLLPQKTQAGNTELG
jgi:hypothetical protein